MNYRLFPVQERCPDFSGMLSGFLRNHCPFCAGISVRISQECCPEWPGISVRFGQEYALFASSSNLYNIREGKKKYEGEIVELE